MSTRVFIEFMLELIDDVGKPPIPTSQVIAQAAIESAWGRRSFFNNHFGIKCHDPDKFAGCRLGRTAEFVDGAYQHNLNLAFQTYHTPQESLEDFYRLMNISRYKPVRDAKDFYEATNQIRLCGYATSPTYTQNLRRLILNDKLYELDWLRDKDHRLAPNFRWEEVLSGVTINGKRYPRVLEPPKEKWLTIEEAALNLQILRDHYQKPLISNSWWRAEHHNIYVGGVRNSRHRIGDAIDVRNLWRVNQQDMANLALRITDFKGIGYGRTFLHLDMGPRRSWSY